MLFIFISSKAFLKAFFAKAPLCSLQLTGFDAAEKEGGESCVPEKLSLIDSNFNEPAFQGEKPW